MMYDTYNDFLYMNDTFSLQYLSVMAECLNIYKCKFNQTQPVGRRQAISLQKFSEIK